MIIKLKNRQLEIDFLPVSENGSGKSGDCILLRFGDLEEGGESQKVIIIDGGYQKNADEVKDHLRKYYHCQDRYGRLQIDCMILSHPDLDHVSGLVALAEDDKVIVRDILMQRPWDILKASAFRDKRSTDHSIKSRLEEAFDKAKALSDATTSLKQYSVERGNSFNIGGAKITILGPSMDFYKQCIANSDKTPEPANTMQLYNSYVAATKKSSQETIYVKGRIPWDDNEGTSEINESSLIFLFEYETQRILFTGDAGKVGLSQAINFAKSRQIDLKNLTLIKMPHHGSRKNVNPQLMDQLGNDATICMISCVQGDEGHHPSKRLVNMLIEKGFTVLTTAGAAACHTYNNPPSREGYNKAESLKPYVTVESI